MKICPICGKEAKGRYIGSDRYEVKHCRVWWMVKEVSEGQFAWIKVMNAIKSDSQRQRVYNACWPVPTGQNLSILAARSYVRKILESGWFKTYYPNHKRPIKIEQLSSRVKAITSGWSEGGTIRVRPITNERTLLHEVAHEVCPLNELHGPIFTQTLIKFTARWHSDPKAAAIMRASFRMRRVKVARG